MAERSAGERQLDFVEAAVTYSVYTGEKPVSASAIPGGRVTQHKGRLTLNVLLSFAQFEREVTGERIRDKIAASKKKGMWMGGNVPLGYDLEDRKLPADLRALRRAGHGQEAQGRGGQTAAA